MGNFSLKKERLQAIQQCGGRNGPLGCAKTKQTNKKTDYRAWDSASAKTFSVPFYGRFEGYNPR